MAGIRQRGNDGLTSKSRNLLFTISDFIKDRGYSPTVAELRDIKGYQSNAVIQQQLAILKDEGYISSKAGCARTIKILKTKTDSGEI